MTINDNVSFDKIPSTDINGRCNPPYFVVIELLVVLFLPFFTIDIYLVSIVQYV